MNLTDGTSLEIGFQITSFQLVEAGRVKMLNGEGETDHMHIIDGRVFHIDGNRIAIELILSAPQYGVGVQI